MTRNEKLQRLKDGLSIATSPLRRHAEATRDSLYATVADSIDNAVLCLAADVYEDVDNPVVDVPNPEHEDIGAEDEIEEQPGEFPPEDGA